MKVRSDSCNGLHGGSWNGAFHAPSSCHTSTARGDGDGNVYNDPSRPLLHFTLVSAPALVSVLSASAFGACVWPWRKPPGFTVGTQCNGASSTSPAASRRGVVAAGGVVAGVANSHSAMASSSSPVAHASLLCKRSGILILILIFLSSSSSRALFENVSGKLVSHADNSQDWQSDCL